MKLKSMIELTDDSVAQVFNAKNDIMTTIPVLTDKDGVRFFPTALAFGGRDYLLCTDRRWGVYLYQEMSKTRG